MLGLEKDYAFNKLGNSTFGFIVRHQKNENHFGVRSISPQGITGFILSTPPHNCTRISHTIPRKVNLKKKIKDGKKKSEGPIGLLELRTS